MPREQSSTGVSFRDVAVYLRDITKRRGGYFSFILAADTSREGQMRLSIVLERRDSVVYSECKNHPLREWAYFPTNDSSTFAGTLLRLCFDIDQRMEARQVEAQSEMPF